MKSEWEELESWSREDLIIELVKARRDMRNIRGVLADLSQTGASSFMYDEGSRPSEVWLRRIAQRAVDALGEDEVLCAADLEMYGVDEDSADRFIEDLRSKEGV